MKKWISQKENSETNEYVMYKFCSQGSASCSFVSDASCYESGNKVV